MTLISDIMNALDRVPIWKALKALPDRVAGIEKRLAVLEARPKTPEAPGCALCGAAMKVVKVEPDPMFGVHGVQRHTLACSGCDHRETRQHDPSAAAGKTG